MPSVAPQAAPMSERARWIWPALAVVLGVSALRIGLLALDRTDLFVDETQYWLWGQTLAFGYYSKPPLIGWVIRAATDLAGSDAAFWVRLPAPLFHAVTAMILAAIAARRLGPGAGVLAAALYITLPMVTVGSALISTDTIMFPFLALALAAWMACLDRGGHAGWAALAGAAVGLGFMAKYVALLYLPGAALAAALVPWARPGWRAARIGLIAFGLVCAPNLLWNLANGLATVQHTLDNAHWVRDPGARAAPDLGRMGAFLATQFIVFAPLPMAGLLWLGLRGGEPAHRPLSRLMLAIALPILGLFCLQAALSGAYANWAASAYLPGLLAILPWMQRRARWLIGATLGLNGAFALLIPLAAAFGTGWGTGDRLLLERYLGRAEMSRQILAEAQAAGGLVVANDRDILADLFYTGRDSGVAIHALPPEGRPRHHYAQSHPFPGSPLPEVLLVTGERSPPAACLPAARQIGRIAPPTGAYRKRPQGLWLVPPACLLR